MLVVGAQRGLPCNARLAGPAPTLCLSSPVCSLVSVLQSRASAAASCTIRSTSAVNSFTDPLAAGTYALQLALVDPRTVTAVTCHITNADSLLYREHCNAAATVYMTHYHGPLA
jgi:hypothetical protein